MEPTSQPVLDTHKNSSVDAPASTAGAPLPHGVREIRTGCIGRGHAGKTALFRAMSEGPIGDYFPSGLHVDVGDPREAARMIREAEETRRTLEMSGLPPTLETPPIRYYLYDGEEQRVIFEMREVIGQVLTHTMPDSAGELQARYEDYLQSLLSTRVLWTVIPCPPPNPTEQDQRRYANDLRIASAYLREALRRRPAQSPCAVALVISKIDTLFENAADARAALTPEVLTESLGPLVNTVTRSTRVMDAAIIPITAFGFGNAVQRRFPTAEERGERHEEPDNTAFAEEPIWLLREGACMQPYNLSTLVLWTLLFGLLNQEVPEGEESVEPELAEICRMLQRDLTTGERWFVPIKGALVPTNAAGACES